MSKGKAQPKEQPQPKKMGRPRKFNTPDLLWGAFEDYIQYQKDNPIPKTHFVGKDGIEQTEFIQRPVTFIGFEGYLAYFDLLKDLKFYEQHPEFTPTITRIRAFCRRYNTDLAAAGALKENIIARIEGIKEQSETTNETRITEVKVEVQRKDG